MKEIYRNADVKTTHVIDQTITDKLLKEAHFKHNNNTYYAGTHLLVELWKASKLTDSTYIEEVLMECVTISKATLLHIHAHVFSDTGGVSAVAVLAESHITIHTWPEINYAALDIFMCGLTNPEKCIPVLENRFATHYIEVNIIQRGKINP